MKHKSDNSAVSPSPLYYLARFALALAPSSLVMVGAGALTPALLEPVAAVHAEGGTEFKVCVYVCGMVVRGFVFVLDGMEEWEEGGGWGKREKAIVKQVEAYKTKITNEAPQSHHHKELEKTCILSLRHSQTHTHIHTHINNRSRRALLPPSTLAASRSSPAA